MARIANDGGRNGWRNQVPSNDAIRALRARRRDITYRKIENKKLAKLNAENYEHLLSFLRLRKKVNVLIME